ncbi:siderophore iron transporter mirb [Colletotrichum kahawae]|uniref:Siderophore iron transporter mirb n=1 Tax=Colletotrichum kahawae TaxID=34407 RepID=A0AAD9YFS6_COLKA|nr:siderophore iron transporter mirb [Colletotrichum kahawae]
MWSSHPSCGPSLGIPGLAHSSGLWPQDNMASRNEAASSPEIAPERPVPAPIDDKDPEIVDEKPSSEIDPNTGGLAGVEKIEALERRRS